MIYDYIKDVIKPEGFEKKNLNKLYKAIARIFDVVINDSNEVINNFYSFFANEQNLEKQRISCGVFKLKNENIEIIRDRLVNLFKYFEALGFKWFFINFMELTFKDRYSYIEIPNQSWYLGFKILGVDTFLFSIRGFRVYIDDLTQKEKEYIENILDIILEADIEYFVLDGKKINLTLGWRLGQHILGVNTFLGHNGI